MILFQLLCLSLSRHSDFVCFSSHIHFEQSGRWVCYNGALQCYVIKESGEKNRTTPNALRLFLLPPQWCHCSCVVVRFISQPPHCLLLLAGVQKASCGSDRAEQILLWKDRRCIILVNILGEKLTMPLNVHSWWRTSQLLSLDFDFYI